VCPVHGDGHTYPEVGTPYDEPMTGTSMKAITYGSYGGPDVLSVSEVVRPHPADGEVSIRVQAAEACKSDTEMRSCSFSASWLSVPMRLVLGVRRPRRPILGLYFAGVIDAVGPGVEGFAVGDEVYGTTGLRLGAYGEYLVLPAKATIAPKPTSMTFAEAAALPLGASNALNGLRRAEVGAGDRVLVNGAGGAIGAYGVQIARLMGGEVTAVDAAYKESFVRSMGATTFVDYHTTDLATLGDRFDVIFDMVPSTPIRRMLDLLQPDGRYVSGNPRFTTMLRASRLPFTDDRIHTATDGESRAALTELAAMVDEGKLVGIVDRVLPMEQAAEAHRLVDTEQRLGAVVLAIGPDAQQHRAAITT